MLKKTAVFFILPSFLTVLSGCAYLQFFDFNQKEKLRQEAFEKETEEIELNKAEKSLANGQNEEALQKFLNFEKSHSRSVFLQSARLGQAQSYERSENYTEALSLYRDIHEKTVNLQPQLAVLALYRMSFCFEAVDEDNKAIAALLETTSLAQYLPKEVAQAEVPARLAEIYARLGQEHEAVEYIMKADKGISKVREEKRDLDLAWLAKTYLLMGTVSDNQLSEENYEQVVRAQQLIQIFLLRSIKLNQKTWSEAASKKLKSTYQKLLNVLERSHMNPEKQRSMGGLFFDMIEQAQLYQPLTGQHSSPLEKDFFDFLKIVKKRTQAQLYQVKEKNLLTEESQKLNSIKKFIFDLSKETTVSQPIVSGPASGPVSDSVSVSGSEDKSVTENKSESKSKLNSEALSRSESKSGLKIDAESKSITRPNSKVKLKSGFESDSNSKSKSDSDSDSDSKSVDPNL